MTLTAEEIVANFTMYRNFCSCLGTRSESVMRMLDDVEERISIAPASSRKKHHAAYPGGLVDHSLRVLKFATSLHSTFPELYGEVCRESIVISALFHDLGKIGQPGRDGSDHYIVEDSAWHREKLGQYYKLNDSITWMENVDRTMLLMITYGIVLSEDEFLAIRLNDGPVVDMNKAYAMKEPPLALLIHIADRMASEYEKQLEAKSET